MGAFRASSISQVLPPCIIKAYVKLATCFNERMEPYLKRELNEIERLQGRK